MRCAITLLVAAMICGCAKYEYDLTQPADLTRAIGRDTDAIATVDPLEYRMRTVDNRLVLRVYNPTDDNIQLLGERSSIVDPEDQSHPLRGGPIAPRSFFKIIIPPPRPEVYSPGPVFGVGVGVGVSNYPHRHYPHYHYNDPIYDEPRFLSVHDESDAYYWDWKGEGQSRVLLVFRRGDKEFRHEFTFRRRKV